MTGYSLIDLGKLSKPATVLIKKISDAVGGIYKPYQMVRCAKAEAEAEKIRAVSQIEITDLQRRALNRFVTEEAQRQFNIEEITRQAIPLLNEAATPEKIENDWITNFFDKSRLISDQEMQRLWANILAGEANAPGSFSKRTVNLLGDLDKSDAELFTSLCGFAWSIGTITPLIFDFQNSIYNSKGINFNSLCHLDTLGLIKFEIAQYQRLRLPKQFMIFYYGRPVTITMSNEENNELQLGRVLLTKAGEDLAAVCGATPVEGFFEYVYDKWVVAGLVPKREVDTDLGGMNS